MMLRVNNLTYSFSEGKQLFQKLSMDVKDGEFVSLIGASGTGKSTLFKLISGLLEPHQGEIIINGEKVFNRLGKVGYMPQKDLLLPWRTVLENVMLPVEVMRGNKQQRILEIRESLVRYGLAGYEQAYPHELSGGMKQRVAFLRTVMTGKKLLLLDEPFGALDSFTKRMMQDWLLALWGDLHKTVLFITHDLEEAILLSDRIYVMSGNDNHIKDVMVNLPRPRSSDLVYSANFLDMRKELERLIRHEGELEEMD